MKSNNLISIITPLFNRESLIKESILSVIHQSNSNWELIVIDDGSTDQSCKIVEEFIKNDSRIRLIKRNRDPKGANTCRNIGIQESSGDYLLFLDSDDVLAPWAIENRWAAIEQKKEYDYYFFPAAYFTEGNKNDFHYYFPNPEDDFLHNFINLKNMLQTSSTLWRKKYIEGLMFDEKLPCWQDCDIHIRALIDSQNYSKSFELPDVWLRKTTKTNSQITNNYDNKNAKILHNYAWPKIQNILHKEQRTIFTKAYFESWVNLIETLDDNYSISFYEIGLKSKTFTKSQKRKLKIYYKSYTLFKKLKMINLPYRLRRLYGFGKRKNTVNRYLIKNEINGLKRKLEDYSPQSPLIKILYEK